MKRLFDFSVAFIFSLLLIPLWLIIAVAIKIDFLTNTDTRGGKVGHWPPVDGDTALQSVATLFGVDQVVARGVAS